MLISQPPTTLAALGISTGTATSAIGATTIAASSTVTAAGVNLNGADGTRRVCASSGNYLNLGGGGSEGTAMGANAYLYTNAAGGYLKLDTGNTAGAYCSVRTANTDRAKFNHDGTVTLDSTTASSWRKQMPYLGAAAYRTNSQGGIAAATATKITFASERFDTENAFASNTYTAPRTGYYHVSLCGTVIPTGADSDVCDFYVYKNGADEGTTRKYFQSGGLAGDMMPYSFAWNLALNANDTIDFYVNISGGGALSRTEADITWLGN